MLAVDLDLGGHNYVVVEEEPYFLLRLNEGKVVVTRDQCPHRGAPLHLGEWNEKSSSLACPLHGACFIHSVLRRRSVPAVRVGSAVTAVFPVDPEASVQRMQKRILANER